MNKTVTCPKCNGYRYINRLETGDYGDGLGWGRTWSEPCKECSGLGTVEVRLTNAECIRTMSDVELLDFIHDTYLKGYDDCWIGKTNLATTLNKIKEWLNQYVGDK